MKNKGAIFDFDGTLADSTKVWVDVDRLFFEVRGRKVPEDYWSNISSLTFLEAAKFTKKTYGIKESIEEIMQEWGVIAKEQYENNVLLKPFVKDYLDKLKAAGVKIGLATASQPEFYLPVLKKFDILQYFEFIIDGSSGFKGKDTPEMYLACAKGLGLEPQDCIVYEDLYKGIYNAKSVGMKTVAVYEEHIKKDLDKIKEISDKFIMCFSELM